MNRRRMILTLAMLFIVSLFLIGFGNWLWAITNYWSFHTPFTISWKPYGILGFGLVACGAIGLAVAIGLLLDWYHLYIIGRASRMNRTSMVLMLFMGFILGLFLIGFGDWLYVFTSYTYFFTWWEGPVKTAVQPYWTTGLGVVICGVLVLAAASILLSDWHHLLIHRHT